jgi:hypothetical protein
MIYAEDARKLVQELINTDDDYVDYACKEIDKRIRYASKNGFTDVRFFPAEFNPSKFDKPHKTFDPNTIKKIQSILSDYGYVSNIVKILYETEECLDISWK